MSTTPLKKVPSVSDHPRRPENEAAQVAAPTDASAQPAAEAKPVETTDAGGAAPAASAPKPPAAAKPNEAKPAAADAKPSGPVAAKPQVVQPAPLAEVKAKPKPAPVVDEKAKPAVVAVHSQSQRPAASVKESEASPSDRPVSEPGVPPKLPARDAAAAVRSLRKARARRLSVRVALGVGLPTVLASIYFFFIASSQYESVSLFTVQSAEARGGLGIETLLGSVPGITAARDTLAVRDYITSREMLAALERKLKLSEHYENPASDWWARLANDASSEDVYSYYQEMVQVDHDSNSGVLTLRVRAFSPEFAKQVSEVVLSESEQMVNQLSERARLDQTKTARAEVATAEARLSKARQAIVKLQREHGEFNPEMTASEAFTLRGSLKAELARARAELMEARAFMQPDAPRVVAIEERVRSLSAQVAEESQRLVNPKSDKTLGNKMADFDEAMVEKEFAQGAYHSAQASLELSRTEAARQHRYLATIAKPSLPSDETHPKRVRGVITMVFLSAMALGMVMLLVEAVREHARI